MWSYQAHDYCRCIFSIFIENGIHILFFEVGISHTVKLVGSKHFTNEKYAYKLMHIKSNSKEWQVNFN